MFNEEFIKNIYNEINRKLILNVSLSSYTINLHDNFRLKILITIDYHEIYIRVLKI